jgi:acetone carboxylase gamma subunit
MDNEFIISLRFSSDTIDFGESILPIEGYEFKYNKKGESVIPGKRDSSFKARSNNLVIDNIITVNNLENNINEIICKLDYLLKKITIDNLKREVCIFCSIENQQFGFLADYKFIHFLSENKCILTFSGIFYL